MLDMEIKPVCKDMVTYQMHFPCRSPSTLNFSESVGGGGAMIGAEWQCPERSAATVKLLPTVGQKYLFLASPGAAFRTRVASTCGCAAVAFGVVSDEVEGMMHGRRGNALTRLVLSSLSLSSFSFHLISVAVSRA